MTTLPSSLVVKSDRRLLRRVLQNLISNAIKYTVTGKVLVGCRRSRDEVRLIVADTGIGIPPKQQKTIFMEFQRLEQGARIERGLGLGLSIVERVVKVLDLRLTLESDSGKGSTFTLHLPRASASHAPVNQAEAALPALAPASLSGRKILVIDNEPSILDGMRRLLEGWSCEIVTAADAAEAMKLLKNSKARPDVMLVDYHLDETNGIDAILTLRRHFRSIVPAVLITAERSQEVRDRAGSEQIEILNKPIKPPALRALLVQIGIKKTFAAE